MKENIILLTQNGSRVYGTHTPTSDWDYVGVAIPPVDYYLGLKSFDVSTDPELISSYHKHGSKYEGTVYELRRFTHLCLSAQPNMWNALFCPEDNVVHQTASGFILRANAHLFISAQVHKSYGGYVRGQMHKIVNGKPPSHKDIMQIERIMRMYEEIITTGKVIVARPDADELLAFRAGEYELDAFKHNIATRLAHIDNIITTKQHNLPTHPDTESINKLLISLISACL